MVVQGWTKEWKRKVGMVVCAEPVGKGEKRGCGREERRWGHRSGKGAHCGRTRWVWDLAGGMQV